MRIPGFCPCNHVVINTLQQCAFSAHYVFDHKKTRTDKKRALIFCII
jgi:hypothetical protein